ncbi:MAG: type II toxin-antitoxin system RelB/DinJ family antitoxin [Clostridia bacterium]|nr:type II toxin-antitoxin system RelB/DinJ family antitoxin [Clostridia bacterium]
MATINIRVDEKLKKESERIFEELGLGMTSAMTIFLKAVVRNNGIPFSLEIPNEETLQAFKEVEDMISGKEKAKRYSSVADLRKDLGV